MKETRLVLGPGTLVELVSPKRIRVFEGELKIAPRPAAPSSWSPPAARRSSGRQATLPRRETGVGEVGEGAALAPRLRGQDRRGVDRLAGGQDRRPRRAADGGLSQGGRRHPRPDRADHDRRVVRQPHRGRLEGVFYFPLPQDASIAGFGMWIGDQLVEADVVEKQRAREIYETILREPAIRACWNGPAAISSRPACSPSPAMSEKRIKITYTQVLPLAGRATATVRLAERDAPAASAAASWRST